MSLRLSFLNKLTIPGLLAAACLPILAQDQQPPDTCEFKSTNAYYQGSPPEPIKLVWRKSDGAIQSWDWLHGGVPWFSFAANKGTAKQESYYYLLDVGITLAAYSSWRYSLKGYIAENIAWPAATFAVIYEGTGTAWFVAHGSLTCT